MASIPGDLPGSADSADAGDNLSRPSGGGMSWSWELDFAALVDAMSGPAPWLRGGDCNGSADGGAGTDAAVAAGSDLEGPVAVDPEAEQAAYVEAVDAGRVDTMPAGVVAGRVSPPCQPACRRRAGRAVAAARGAWADAAERGRHDAAAGGCAHALASAAYRPPPRIAALVTARDQTCRFGPCRRPASQCDLDHDIPYDQGGLTCPCNIGGKCRQHHQLKQHPRWAVTQPQPGTFRWTTPTGRTYTTQPDPYLT